MKIRFQWSFFTICTLAIVIFAVRFISTPYRALSWDVFGYYLYLPSTFIYDDPGLKERAWLDKIQEKYNPSPTLYQLVEGEDGNRVIKYSAGMALLYSPFFFTAHFISPLLGYPADGFSPPYPLIICFGGILWITLGLFAFRRLLLQFFNDKITSFLLILIIAGTNFFHLASLDGTLLTHNALFTIYALLCLVTINWHEKPSALLAISTGLLIGLTILIRPSEGISFLIPLLWNTGSKTALNQKIQLIRKYPLHLLLVVIGVIAVGSVQMYYWIKVSGEWLFYSYENPGEGFRFLPPYLLDFLLSFRKGWLIYTPLMIFSLFGFWSLLKRKPEIFPAISLFFILDLWIVSSWSCWWYAGGSFSARAIVPAYVLLSLPLGYFIEGINKRWKNIAFITGGLLVLLNLFQSWQFHKGIIDKERMTFPYYKAIFGKTHINRDKLDELLLVERSTESREQPAHPDRYSGKILFQSDTLTGQDTTGAIRLDGTNQFAPGPDLPYSELTQNDHVWIRSSVEIFLPSDYSGTLPLLVTAFHHDGKAYKYRSETLEDSTVVKNRWQKLTYWYLTPEVRTKEDNLKIYVWHRDVAPVFIRNLKVEIFELKKNGEK